MASLTGVHASLLEFSIDASDLAIVTADGRVRLFNAARQKLRADITQPLSGTTGLQPTTSIYSCIDWSQQIGSEKIVYLGSTSGEVKAFDTARSELKWSVLAAVDGSIAAVNAGASGRLLVAGKTGTVAVVDTSTGAVVHRWRASKYIVSAAALLPDNKAIVAGSGISIFDCTTSERVGKLTGHATPVTALAVTSDGKYCCTAAEGERQVAVWSLEFTKTGKLLHKSAIARLDLEHPATHITICPTASHNEFHIAVVTRDGALRVFECAANSEGGVSCQRWAATNTTSSTKSGVLQVAASGADADGVTLIVASGAVVKPTIQSVRIEKADNGSVARIDILSSEGGLLLGGSTSAQKQQGKQATARSLHEPASILGAEEGTLMASKLVTGGKRVRDVEPTTDQMDVDDDNDNELNEEQQQQQEEEELTFAQRLAALQEAQQGINAAPSSAEKQKASSKQAAALDKGPIKADSLAVLLSQAIQSGDKILLERCLLVTKEEVIKNTVKRLSPGDAAEFLRLMVLRLQSSPARGEQLATWIRSVLIYHTGYLAGVGGMSGTLGYLYQLIEARLASYQPLLALSGRLDVVLANARRASEISAAGGGGGFGGGGGPLVAVEVGSDGGIEVEDAFAAAGLSDTSDDDEGGSSDDDDGEDADLNGFDSDDDDEDDE